MERDENIVGVLIIHVVIPRVRAPTWIAGGERRPVSLALFLPPAMAIPRRAPARKPAGEREVIVQAGLTFHLFGA